MYILNAVSQACSSTGPNHAMPRILWYLFKISSLTLAMASIIRSTKMTMLLWRVILAQMQANLYAKHEIWFAHPFHASLHQTVLQISSARQGPLEGACAKLPWAMLW